ncbi:nucleotide pyrophosphohydrolase domain protein [Sphingobium phage Lacusarx]|uniref:Nucleotide pyrophosphohydrolase domain protein n=1 Tax=Sphingobium phage Lacusarx TaxID=1980139 RepID=A0A1W6DX21_9CAUD|nr:MazG-like pyrophosphatase [Sphingobium phage Lacusarx]ARK07441.1 nucleotide pyrophosphohydrolase domain protein [Sphingobium phage Lacusarx]
MHCNITSSYVPKAYALPDGGQITHPDLVTFLAKPGDAILASLTAEKADAWHMASCIPGEAGELFEPLNAHAQGFAFDRDNLIEELGDIEFYVQGLRAATGIYYYETMASKIDIAMADFTDLPKAAADVFDVTKKWVIYNKPLDRSALLAALCYLEAVLESIRSVHGVSRDETLGKNVWKLGQRYKELRYSDSAAQLRADKTESVH